MSGRKSLSWGATNTWMQQLLIPSRQQPWLQGNSRRYSQALKSINKKWKGVQSLNILELCGSIVPIPLGSWPSFNQWYQSHPNNCHKSYQEVSQISQKCNKVGLFHPESLNFPHLPTERQKVTISQLSTIATQFTQGYRTELRTFQPILCEGTQHPIQDCQISAPCSNIPFPVSLTPNSLSNYR